MKVGQRLTLSCVTDANPAPERYSWHHSNDQKEVHSLGSSTLTFTGIERADEACYACSATNAISTGEKSKPVCIFVHCKYFGNLEKVHKMFNSCMSLYIAKINEKKNLNTDLI